MSSEHWRNEKCFTFTLEQHWFVNVHCIDSVGRAHGKEKNNFVGVTRDYKYLQSIKFRHELHIFDHTVAVDGNFLQKWLKLLLWHVQLESSFDSCTELLLSQQTRILTVNIAVKQQEKDWVNKKMMTFNEHNHDWTVAFKICIHFVWYCIDSVFLREETSKKRFCIIQFGSQNCPLKFSWRLLWSRQWTTIHLGRSGYLWIFTEPRSGEVNFHC